VLMEDIIKAIKPNPAKRKREVIEAEVISV
jgi:hypothetical protein